MLECLGRPSHLSRSLSDPSRTPSSPHPNPSAPAPPPLESGPLPDLFQTLLLPSRFPDPYQTPSRTLPSPPWNLDPFRTLPDYFSTPSPPLLESGPLQSSFKLQVNSLLDPLYLGPSGPLLILRFVVAAFGVADDELLQHLFSAADPQGSGSVSFSQFANALSVIFRGEKKEIWNFWFKVRPIR